MAALTSTLTLLSAMTTPAILVLANGSLITITSQRLSGSLDQQRNAARQLRDYRRQPPTPPNPAEHAHLSAQLSYAARRARLLQQALTVFQVALGLFIACICSIGVFEFLNLSAAWLLALLSIGGALLLLLASVLMVREARLSLASVAEETTYLTKDN